MSTARTPQDDRAGTSAAAGAAAAPLFNHPPPAPTQVVMTTDQFETLMKNCGSPGFQPPTQAIAQDDGGVDFPGVSSVSVKLPTFWTNDPELWFLQTESIFNSRTPKVTRDATKFDHCVSALPPEALNSVQQIIKMPAATPNRYRLLKDALQLTYGKTQAQRHVELISYAAAKEPVLDMKPSNMLLHVRDLSGDSKAAFERAVILNRLPHSVRTLLSTSTAATNEAWALEANQAMEAFLLSHPGATPASIMALESASSPSCGDSVDVAAVSRPQRGPDPPFLCFIHQRYGSKAFSCKSPRCPMHHLVQKRPTPAPGNGRAGR